MISTDQISVQIEAEDRYVVITVQAGVIEKSISLPINEAEELRADLQEALTIAKLKESDQRGN